MKAQDLLFPEAKQGRWWLLAESSYYLQTLLEVERQSAATASHSPQIL